jgi:hypothetical protein
MTLFFSNSASGKRPPEVTPIGAADDLMPGPEVGPPRPACRRRPAVRNASGGDGGPGRPTRTRP